MQFFSHFHFASEIRRLGVVLSTHDEVITRGNINKVKIVSTILCRDIRTFLFILVICSLLL